jgi:hypothetical protein
MMQRGGRGRPGHPGAQQVPGLSSPKRPPHKGTSRHLVAIYSPSHCGVVEQVARLTDSPATIQWGIVVPGRLAWCPRSNFGGM